MPLIKTHRQQIQVEEWSNAAIHFFGVIAAMAGFWQLVMLAAKSQDPLRWIASFTFGGSLVLMFLSSTLYHLAQDPIIKKRLKVFDHSSIFLLIAGTYTPFMLITLHSTFAYTLLSIIWLIAITGVTYKCFFVYHYPKLSTLCYLLMGWLAVFAINPLYHHLSHQGLYWMVAGGLCYTIGVVFYAWKRLYFSHAIWHLFVIAGCGCHFWAVLNYVFPY